MPPARWSVVIGCKPTKASMTSEGVVLLLIFFGKLSGFFQGAEEFTGEQFIPELPIERLH